MIKNYVKTCEKIGGKIANFLINNEQKHLERVAYQKVEQLIKAGLPVPLGVFDDYPTLKPLREKYRDQIRYERY